MLTEGLRLVLAMAALGVATAGCGKSVEVIGLGPLDNDAQPEPEPTSPAASDDSSLPMPTPSDTGATDGEGPSSPADASVPPVASPAPDASSAPDASAAPDASSPSAPDAGADEPDAAASSPLGPFGAPSPLEAYGGSDDASFTADGLEMYMDVDDTDQIHVATRASRDEAWGEASPVPVGGDGSGKTPWITPDGLELYFSAEREGGLGATDIWRLARPDRASAWGEAQPVSDVNTSLEEFAPSLSADGLQLVLTRAAVGLGAQELWLARRDTVEAPWQAPTLMSISDPDKKDSDAVFTANDLELWWVRAVTDANHDLYFARRAALDLPFETPTPVTELNSSAHEGDPWLSQDGREVVFFSTRSGERLLYRATR